MARLLDYLDIGLKPETVVKIDAMRGIATRTAYVRDILEKHTGTKE